MATGSSSLCQLRLREEGAIYGKGTSMDIRVLLATTCVHMFDFGKSHFRARVIEKNNTWK